MSEKEKMSSESLEKNLPKLDKTARSFLIGYGEGYIAAKENKSRKKDKKEKEKEVKPE